MTQIILDISSSLETSPCKIYVIDKYPEGSGDYWDSEKFLLRSGSSPWPRSSRKSKQANSNAFIHVLQWKDNAQDRQIAWISCIEMVRFSHLTYSISVIGGRFIELPQHEWYLNQGSLQSCFFESNAGSLHCRFDRDLIDDTRQWRRVNSLWFFVKEADLS